jgi:hypothetical protein
MAKEKEKDSGKNLNDPQTRQAFKSSLAAITYDFDAIDKLKETIKEDVSSISQQYGIDKKLVRKLAVTMYKHNYSTIQEENEHFAAMYETIIEGRVGTISDPLDRVDEDEGSEGPDEE